MPLLKQVAPRQTALALATVLLVARHRAWFDWEHQSHSSPAKPQVAVLIPPNAVVIAVVQPWATTIGLMTAYHAIFVGQLKAVTLGVLPHFSATTHLHSQLPPQYIVRPNLCLLIARFAALLPTTAAAYSPIGEYHRANRCATPPPAPTPPSLNPPPNRLYPVAKSVLPDSAPPPLL